VPLWQALSGGDSSWKRLSAIRSYRSEVNEISQERLELGDEVFIAHRNHDPRRSQPHHDSFA
jgi:hypothetical protein